MSNTVTLQHVKRAMERMFIPNIIITWDDKFKMYKVEPHFHTEYEMARLNYTANDGVEGMDIGGIAWIKQYKGLKLHNTLHITASNLESAMRSMGNCGITYQITDKEDEGNQD